MTDELYTREPKRVSRDYYSIEPHNHPAGRDELKYNDGTRGAGNERIEIRYYDAEEYNGSPTWLLASAWLDGKPFMVIYNGNDEVTDSATHQEAMDYLLSITDCQKCVEVRRVA